jgi:hypothetical protein
MFGFIPKCFVSEITPGFLEQYRLQKQQVQPRQTGEAMAVRSPKLTASPSELVLSTP